MLLYIIPFKEISSAVFYAVINLKCWHNHLKHNMSVHLICSLP